MAIFGRDRDVSLFRNINKELLRDVITQQCAYYKFRLDETKVNIYGESAGVKYYNEPVLLNCLINRSDQEFTSGDFGVDHNQNIEFYFYRQFLQDASLVVQPGDIIQYYEDYFEVHDVVDNQLFVGKDPSFPYNTNPWNPGLENFGQNISVIAKTFYIPADKVQITLERGNA
mgnify:FL=1|jgi:hypothetical protein|tara:strand:- start:1333 stop:1848 length:516 start_codon:yes stop_codon:yes gene_type:complete